MTQVVIYGVGRSNYQQGTHEQLMYWLKDYEKRLIMKGKLPLDNIDLPLEILVQ